MKHTHPDVLTQHLLLEGGEHWIRDRVMETLSTTRLQMYSRRVSCANQAKCKKESQGMEGNMEQGRAVQPGLIDRRRMGVCENYCG
jgi:hypothetical protein